jgi:hypothetical protein
MKSGWSQWYSEITCSGEKVTSFADYSLVFLGLGQRYLWLNQLYRTNIVSSDLLSVLCCISYWYKTLLVESPSGMDNISRGKHIAALN